MDTMVRPAQQVKENSARVKTRRSIRRNPAVLRKRLDAAQRAKEFMHLNGLPSDNGATFAVLFARFLKGLPAKGGDA